MEETLTGDVTEMSAATYNKGRLRFIVELYLFLGIYVGTERMPRGV